VGLFCIGRACGGFGQVLAGFGGGFVLQKIVWVVRLGALRRKLGGVGTVRWVRLEIWHTEGGGRGGIEWERGRPGEGVNAKARRRQGTPRGER
jgi:hypothetical protein